MRLQILLQKFGWITSIAIPITSPYASREFVQLRTFNVVIFWCRLPQRAPEFQLPERWTAIRVKLFSLTLRVLVGHFN